MVEFGENGAVIQPEKSQRTLQSEYAYPDGTRSALGLFRWFQVGFLLSIAFSVVLGLLFALAIVSPNLFNVMLDEYAYESTPLDLVMIATGFGFIFVFVFCVVMTCRLTYRTCRNLHTIGSDQVRYSPTMSVVYYFIPFANLVMPALAASDIYRGTKLATDGKVQNGLISFWWISWLFSSFADSFSSAIGYTVVGIIASLVSIVLSIIAAYMLLRIFREISHAQEALKYGGVANVFS